MAKLRTPSAKCQDTGVRSPPVLRWHMVEYCVSIKLLSMLGTACHCTRSQHVGSNHLVDALSFCGISSNDVRRGSDMVAGTVSTLASS